MATTVREFVCASCIEDLDLQALVRAAATSQRCDYCAAASKRRIACHIDVVHARIKSVIDQYYDDPRNFEFWDGREGGWQGHPVFDGIELFDEIGFQVSNDQLMEDITSPNFDLEYAASDHWPGSASQRTIASWKHFKDVVKHERRYTFWSIDDEPDRGPAEITPSRMLKAIEGAIDHIGLSAEVPTGTHFWRVSVHRKSVTLKRASDFSSPPADKAVFPSRMSPAGVSMLYAAEKIATAIAETVDRSSLKGKVVSAAAFRNVRPLNILDLTALPRAPGFFSALEREWRESLKFLAGFTADISQPVSKDGSEHTEHVPTQVFTEFIRYEAVADGGSRYDGIKYPSSKNGDSCYVLFANQKQCLSKRYPWDAPQLLKFILSSRRTFKHKR